jgi:putative peptidoglycan lipid II flippase
MVNILARAFYAVQDIRTPMRISIFCLALNLIISAFLLFETDLEAGALGIANSLTSFCNLALLLFALRKKLGKLEMEESVAQLPRLALAGLLTGFTAWGMDQLWLRYLGHANMVLKLGEVFLPLAVASVLYFALGLWWRVPSAREISGFLLAGFRPKA